MVSRTGLVNRLRAARSFPVASIVAPRGYGKTTLLAQWAARDDRPFAFVALDTRVTDAAALVARIAEAAPTLASDVPARGSDAPDTWAWGTAVPRLAGGALAAEPFVLVLDDAQLLTADAARVVTMLVRQLARRLDDRALRPRAATLVDPAPARERGGARTRPR